MTHVEDFAAVAESLATAPDLMSYSVAYLRDEEARLVADETGLIRELTALDVFPAPEELCRQFLNGLKGTLRAADFQEAEVVLTKAFASGATQLSDPAIRDFIDDLYGRISLNTMQHVEEAAFAWASYFLQYSKRGLEAHPDARPLYGRLMGVQAHRTVVQEKVEAAEKRGVSEDAR